MAELCANLEPPLTFTLRPPTSTLSSSFSPSMLSTSLPASLVAALPAALPPSSGLAAMASGRAPLPPTGFGTVDALAAGRGSSGGGGGGGGGGNNGIQICKRKHTLRALRRRKGVERKGVVLR